MSLTPQNNQNAFVQSYSAIFAGDAPKDCVQGLLATSTGSFVYTSGAIVAQYTAGGSVGKYVNYNSAGSNGQAVPVGVIWDDDFVNGTAPTGLVRIALPKGGLMLYVDQLSTQVSGHVATALTAWNAIVTTGNNGRTTATV